jgi:hypothetical protein
MVMVGAWPIYPTGPATNLLVALTQTFVSATMI